MEREREILTVGHSAHPIERFLELLDAARIGAIADVRRRPGSRRNPQYNAEVLAASLRETGIDYAGFGDELGGRRDPGGPGPGDWRAAYRAHTASAAYAAGLARLEALGRERRTAVMCAEGDWRSCHRQFVAESLADNGWGVVHLLPGGGREQHPQTIFPAP